MVKKINKQGIAKIGLVLAIGLAVIGFCFSIITSEETHKAAAGTATTSVTVVNTPPEWSVDAQEASESSSNRPTNAGSGVSWNGTATDPNNESYYLLVCSTSSNPTANSGAPPTCAGGLSNRWGVSSLTASGAQATVSYTSTSSNPESNNWWAWICDGNAFNPRCNTTSKQGTGNTASPFEVNHRPTFTVYSDDSPKLPGQTVTWYATSSDSDTSGAQDQVKLFVCRANDFTGIACGAGGTYCESATTTSNPSCNAVLGSPLQDRNYTAYGFILDWHGFAASGGSHGTDSVLTVANASPTLASSTISLLDTDEAGALTISQPSAQTTGFKVRFTITDTNSCLNSSSGNEIASAIINVYRSGVGQASCQAGSDYNANRCYPAAVGTSTWNISCTQDAGQCSGASDPDTIWTCTFPLWYIADATDGTTASDSQYYNQNWQTSVRVTDDNGATSTLTESSAGNENTSFLAYSLNTSSISYGAWEPGQGNDPIDKTTVVSATGNVGLDQTLYGTHMCTTYPTCNGGATSTVYVTDQRYATSSLSYASSTSLALDPGAELELDSPKSTSTSTPATKSTYWGVQIPLAVTIAGDYTGVDTIIGIKGEAQNW